jgi:hypothetical protein
MTFTSLPIDFKISKTLINYFVCDSSSLAAVSAVIIVDSSVKASVISSFQSHLQMEQ